MSDKVKTYWKMRCARWGDFEISGRGFSCTNWHRLINGTPHNQLKDDTVRDLSEQAETAVFIRHLDAQGQVLARAAFAGDQTHLAETFLNTYCRTLERLRIQRLNGEPLDPLRRKNRPRIAKIKIDNHTVAATCHDE